jgi:1-phosphofructokinase
MCASLGASVTLCATVGGEIGAVIARLPESEDLRVRTVARTGSSAWYVHDRRDGERATIAEHPGVALGRHDSDKLYTNRPGLMTGTAVSCS